jgi:hypothetical protein
LALENVIKSTKIVPSGKEIGKEQLNILAYADDIALIGKNEIEIRSFCRNGEHFQKVQIMDKPRQDKTVERKNSLKKNKIGHLKIKITNLKEWKILNI